MTLVVLCYTRRQMANFASSSRYTVTDARMLSEFSVRGGVVGFRRLAMH